MTVTTTWVRSPTKGIEYPGHHKPLISRDIFDRSSFMLDTRRAGGVRERNHNHYLKGTLWCHRCQRRLIINLAKNKWIGREDGYLDLIGDPQWPKEKVSQRLRQVRDERERLQRQLASTDNPQINAGRKAIEILLDLLNDPREIYRLASKRARKVLNQVFFVKMFVDMDPGGPYIATDECTKPVERLHNLKHKPRLLQAGV